MQYFDPKADRDNRSNQLNRNNDEFWNSRGTGSHEDECEHEKLCDSDPGE